MYLCRRRVAQTWHGSLNERFSLIRLACIGGGLLLASDSLAAAGLKIDFSRDIQPIFSENCYACHGPEKDKRKAGLRLDLKEGAFAKLDSGAMPSSLASRRKAKCSKSCLSHWSMTITCRPKRPAKT